MVVRRWIGHAVLPVTDVSRSAEAPFDLMDV